MSECGKDLPLAGNSGRGGCGCHDLDSAVPELDARAIPHAIRHAAIFGALDSLPTGGALDLVAPHDPKPLLAQAQDRYPAGVTVAYLEQGPDAWRLRLTRN